MNEVIIGVVVSGGRYRPARYFQDSVEILGSETFPTSIEAQTYGRGWHAAEMKRSERETTAAWENRWLGPDPDAKSYVPHPPLEEALDAQIAALSKTVGMLWADKLQRDLAAAQEKNMHWGPWFDIGRYRK